MTLDDGTYECLCGMRFSNKAQLEEHIRERIDASDWKQHGVKG